MPPVQAYKKEVAEELEYESFREQLKAEQGRVSAQAALLAEHLPLEMKEPLLIAEDHLKSETAKAYIFEGDLEVFVDNTVPKNDSLLALQLLIVTMEQAGLKRIPAEACEESLATAIRLFGLKLGDLSYYVRELDDASKFHDKRLIETDSATWSMTGELVHAFVETYLLREEISSFHKKLVDLRRSLSKHMLLSSCITLQFVYGISPDFKLFSLIFGDRIESIINPKKATRSGAISFDRFFKQFLIENGLPFSTEGLLSVLDRFFDSYSTQHPNWFRDVYSKVVVSPSKIAGMTGGVFNYSGWGDGRPFPYGHTALTRPPPYPGDYRHVIHYLANEVGLNKELRNYTREFLGVPRVGEGQWVSELNVLKIAEKAAAPEKVIHQWSPDWLSPQRLDVGVPSLRLAFEYNGKQHYEPVEHFGGEEAYKKLRRLDAKKVRRCIEHSINIVPLKYDLTGEKIIQLVEETIANAKKVWIAAEVS